METPKYTLPPVTVAAYVRDTEKGPHLEWRLNLGVSVESVETFAIDAHSKRRIASLGIIATIARIGAAVAGCIGVSALWFTLFFQYPMATVLICGGLAVALLSAAIACRYLTRRTESQAVEAAADRAEPFLDLLALSPRSENRTYVELWSRLTKYRSVATPTPAREEQLFAATRAIADYIRSPTPGHAGNRMYQARQLRANQTVTNLAKDYREAVVTNDAARERAKTLVDEFARSVIDEILIPQFPGSVQGSSGHGTADEHRSRQSRETYGSPAVTIAECATKGTC